MTAIKTGSLLCLLLANLLSVAMAEQREVRWQSVTLAGDKIGHRQLVRQVSERAVTTTETLVITLQQPGEEPRSSETTLVYVESPEGRPLSLEKLIRSHSANHRMTAVVEGDELKVSRGAEQQRFALTEPFLLREGVRRALLEQTGRQRELEYYSWNFSALRLERFRVRATALSEGPYAWELERKQLEPARADVTRLLADEQFMVREERALTAGDELVLRDCDKACALADFYPVTHVYRQLIRAPVRINESALRGKIRYRLAGDFTLEPPETDEQRVTRLENDWQLEVCGDCGREPAPDAAALVRALSSNYWIAADHRDIRTAVTNVLGEEADKAPVVERMQALTRFVGLYMSDQPDYSGYATALEALDSRSGDCTEHALLLAALARAAGIPTRVVVGIAYTNERFLGRKYVFVPHAWVQAWTGERWQSFDSGLGDFTAGYIALGFSDGELADIARVNEQLHRIEIASAVQVKQR